MRWFVIGHWRLWGGAGRSSPAVHGLLGVEMEALEGSSFQLRWLGREATEWRAHLDVHLAFNNKRSPEPLPSASRSIRSSFLADLLLSKQSGGTTVPLEHNVLVPPPPSLLPP